MGKLKRAIIISTVATGVLIGSAATFLYIKDQMRKKEIGGRLIRVNYKYSKVYDV